MALGIFISAGTSVYAAEQIQDSQNQVDKVAKEFEDLFTNGLQINENSYAINSDYLVQNYL